MKKIGLLSDTHGYLDSQLTDHFIGCDEIWHAGDIGSVGIIRELQAIAPLRAVYGNIDGRDIRSAYPEQLQWNESGLDFWMIHIGGSIGRYPSEVREKLIQDPPDVFVCGHSHILQVGRAKKYDNMIHINPGAAGRYGAQIYRTCVRFDIKPGLITNMEVIHL